MAEPGASQVATDNTQISAAAHAVTLAVLKLNRLIPKALLSILGRLSRWRADRRKKAVESRIIQAKIYISMNEELLQMSEERSIKLPEALQTRIQEQRDEHQKAMNFSIKKLFTSQTGRTEITRVELNILNRKHKLLIDLLQGRLEEVDHSQRRWLKAAVIPTELFCLVAGLVVWCSIVIGLILGLGNFNKQDSFVTAFTIITSVATSEYDYFRRIVLAGRKSSESLFDAEQQPPQGEQGARAEPERVEPERAEPEGAKPERSEPEAGAGVELSTAIRTRPFRETIQPALEELV